MNLEYKRMIDTGFEHKRDLRLLAERTDEEALLAVGVKMLQDMVKHHIEQKNYEAAHPLAALLEPSVKALHNKRIAANYFRAKVQQNIKEESAKVAQVEVQA